MARLIDGDALIAWIKGSQQMTSKMKSIICYIKTMPTIDAVSVVRCKDCKYAHMTYDGSCKYCDMWKDDDDICLELYLDDDFYCADGERKNHE